MTTESTYRLPAVCQGRVTPNWGDRPHATEALKEDRVSLGHLDRIVVPRVAVLPQVGADLVTGESNLPS